MVIAGLRISLCIAVEDHEFVVREAALIPRTNMTSWLSNDLISAATKTHSILSFTKRTSLFYCPVNIK